MELLNWASALFLDHPFLAKVTVWSSRHQDHPNQRLHPRHRRCCRTWWGWERVKPGLYGGRLKGRLWIDGYNSIHYSPRKMGQPKTGGWFLSHPFHLFTMALQVGVGARLVHRRGSNITNYIFIYIYMYVCICVCNVLIEPFSLKGKIWDMGSIDFWRMYGYKYLYMCIHQPTTLLSKRGLGGLEFQHFLPQWKTDLLKSQQDDGRNPYLKNWDILEERHNNSLSKIFRPLKVR